MSSIAVIIPSWNKDRASNVVANLREFDGLNLVTSATISGANLTEHRRGPVESMLNGAVDVKSFADILVFCHDDIEVYEDWSSWVTGVFDARPDAGLVGFHGAKGLGSDDIYRTKYQLPQLARYNPLSNMVDAESHGKRTGVACEVATVDGFFMAIRTTAYEAVGGWEACLRDRIVFHMYDSWMAMAVREHGYRTFLAPVSCRHSGGATEVGMAEEYEKWAKENGFVDSSEVHTKGHSAFYERFRGQLPLRVI